MTRARWWVLGVAAVAALGCGGIWQEVQAESLSELALDVQRVVPASDPNRGRVLDTITDVWVAQWEHGLGVWTLIAFDTAVRDAMADGRIEPGEVLIIDERAAGLGAPPVDPARREEILAIKDTIDGRVRAERDLPGPDEVPVER